MTTKKKLKFLMSSQLKTVVPTIIYFKLWVHMVNVHLCKKNHKNRMHQKKKDRSRRCKYIQSIDMFLIMKSKQILNHKAMVTTKT